MAHRINRRAVMTGVVCASVGACAPPSKTFTDQKIRDLLVQRVGPRDQKIGIIVAVLENGAYKTFAHGSTGMPDNSPVGTDTVFEIGSITKLLTALILADMASTGEVNFQDPVIRHLPAGVKVPEYGRPITLLDLANYRSGLPNMPDDLTFTGDNPLADYTSARLYAFLSRYAPRYKAGTHYEYANLAFGLLGLALSYRAGRSYETLLLERVCDPLGLKDTRITLSNKMRSHVAQGHDDALKAIPLWDMPALEGAGAARSTANDMTVFLQACMGLRQMPLSPQFATLLATSHSTGAVGIEAALGWFISAGQWWHGSDSEEKIVWKTGRTGGFLSNIAYSLRSGRGALVLSNGPIEDGQNIAFDLIRHNFYPGNVGSVA